MTSVRWDTGLISGGPSASAIVRRGQVATVRVTTADVPDAVAGADRLILDAFADQVEVVSSEAGPPRSQKPGRTPSVEWDLTSGAALKVLGGDGSCEWVLTSPKFVEIKRDLAGRGPGGSSCRHDTRGRPP